MKKTLSLLVTAVFATQLQCAHVRRQLIPKLVTVSSFDTGGIKVDKSLEERLSFIADVKNFGMSKLGLISSENYMRYRTVEDARTLYLLYVAPKTELPDYLGNYRDINEDEEYREVPDDPIILHSKLDKLVDEEEYYVSNGYDVLRRVVQDFDDGKGCDLTPLFLANSTAHQVRTILHEDWHHTYDVLRGGGRSREVNESAAQVVGYAGSIEFMRLVYGESSKEYRSATSAYDHAIKHAKLVNSAYDELQEIYDSNISEEKKVKARESVFKRLKNEGYIYNNASLWDMYPYTKHFISFVNAYEKLGSVKDFVDMMKGAPTDEAGALKYVLSYGNKKNKFE